MASSESESLRTAEKDFLHVRNQLLAEREQLIDERKKNLEKLKELESSSSQKSELLEMTWNKEKASLEVRLLTYYSIVTRIYEEVDSV